MRKFFIYVIIAALIYGTSFIVYKSLNKNKSDGRTITTGNQSTNNISLSLRNKSPLLIKNLPIQIKKYDPATNKAGDLVFTKNKLEYDRLYLDYGFMIPASPDYPTKINPQPIFIAPLGTKVRAIIDGIVVDVSKLYSNDYTILLAENEKSQIFYEVEHVLNPLVKVDDKVKAGDVVAEVTTFGVGEAQGYGMVEIGVFMAGNPPKHVCPYLYLDPEYKEDIQQTLSTLYDDWNIYKGEILYDLGSYKSVGCLTHDEIPG